LAKHENLQLNKSLGQHFLTDQSVLLTIASAINEHCAHLPLLEVGPGAGALSKLLKTREQFLLVEFDKRWAQHIQDENVELKGKVICADFLQLDLNKVFEKEYAIVGNFPYNISSQIVFHILDYKDKVPLMLGMFQKEVAKRICAKEGSKDFGIISLLTQLYFETEYLFDVGPEAFNPPPQVVSGVMLMRRRIKDFEVNPVYLKTLIKTAFSQRRKTLRNSLKSYLKTEEIKSLSIFDKRPEQLSLEAFINLSNFLEVL
jgi:16S rRNA (adenine1518-N6/adenine1519-N6)-dimethyltransferase